MLLLCIAAAPSSLTAYQPRRPAERKYSQQHKQQPAASSYRQILPMLNPTHFKHGSHSPLIPWKTLGFNYWFYKHMKTLGKKNNVCPLICPPALEKKGHYTNPRFIFYLKKLNKKIKSDFFVFHIIFFPLLQIENEPLICIMTLCKSPW